LSRCRHYSGKLSCAQHRWIAHDLPRISLGKWIVLVYEELRAAGKKFEIVFVSSDSDEDQFEEYFDSMPWLAVPYNDSGMRETLKKRFKVDSIPKLVLVDKAGKIITHDGSSTVLNDPNGASFPWRTKKSDDEFDASMESSDGVRDITKEYYGQHLQASEDLKTNACCTTAEPPAHIAEAISNVHDAVNEKYYGCGLCVPDDVEGCAILDLGCGAGRDVYIASQLVGAKGRVVGVDMTQEQLNVAEAYKDWHAEKFGFANVEFKLGYIEKLDELGLEAGSFDIIVSNCVINLSPDKEAVLREAYRLLKPGGELYFSDVYSDRRMPKHLREDPVLWGECVSGALYWNDFHNLAKQAGFLDPRLMKDNVLTINNKKLEAKMGCIKVYSATYRLWKLEGLESHCEDYGQAVIYKGTIPHCPDVFDLDGHHSIEKGKVFPVCGNTWKMMADTRFKRHFEFIGNFDTHYGIYDGCGTLIPFESAKDGGAAGGGCC